MIFRPKMISKLRITPPKPHPDRADLAIAVVVKNEARHIGEWLDFHLRAGVCQFILYDNGSTDETIEVAKSHLPDGKLTLLPWDQKLFDGRSGVEIHNQVLAFAHALRNFGGQFRWMAFTDIDEFLVPMKGGDLLAALAPRSDAAHISLPWHMFGRCGHDQAPEGGIVANYTQRARDPLASSHALNWKCIIDPCRVTGVRVHGFEIEGEAAGVNDVGQTSTHQRRSNPSFYSNAAIQLNHYYTRSDQELQTKIARGSNKTVEAQKHIKRVMRIVDAIEADTVEDRSAIEFLNRV